jgi:hypothetical protein
MFVNSGRLLASLLVVFPYVSITSANPIPEVVVSTKPSVADCLYDRNPAYVQGSGTIPTSDLEACAGQPTKRGMPRVDPGPAYNTSEITPRATIPSDTFHKRGIDFSAEYFDDVHEVDGEQQILSNFMEPGQLNNSWSPHICRTITKVDPKKAGDSAVFSYNIQGTHKTGISLVHQGHYLHVLASLTVQNTDELPKHDLMALCQGAMSKASESVHSLNYDAFNSKTVYSVINGHTIAIEAPSGKKKRDTINNGSQWAIIHLQFGDQAKDISLFNGNGLPLAN